MRIAFLVHEFPVLSQTFILNQITGLIDLGHEVDIYAISPGETEPRHPQVDAYGLMARTRQVHGRRAVIAARALRHAWSKPGDLRVLLRSLDLWRYGRRAWRLHVLSASTLFLSESYDIVQCHFGRNGEMASILKEIGALRARIVTMFHGYDVREGLAEGPSIYACLARHGDAYLAISRANRSHLEALGFAPERIVDHTVGVDPRSFDAPSTGPQPEPRREPEREPERGLQVLSIARLVPIKGLEYGIRGLAELRRLRPGLEHHYEIVGAGPLEPALRKLVSELQLGGDSVTFRGAVDQQGVVAALQRADVLLIASGAEALPVVAMEAQAAGLPVVATDVGSMRELVADGESGYLVPPRDSAAIARSLAALLDPERRRAMGRAGRAGILAHHDIDRLNRELVEIYRGLLSGRADDSADAPEGDAEARASARGEAASHA